jgi:hypothetical protein
MSKMAAIDAAVRLQIASDGKTIPYASALNVAATGYATSAEVEKFLLGVAIRLKLDTPPLMFEWASLDSEKTMSKTRLLVQSLIEEKTKEPIEEKAKAPGSK